MTDRPAAARPSETPGGAPPFGLRFRGVAFDHYQDGRWSRTQLAALRYGSLPVAARVGGLADTVVDANDMALASSAGTGFVFSPVSRETLEIVIDRAAALWRQQVIWRRVQVRAMFTDVSWTRPARRYAALYRELAAHAHVPAHA